MSGLFDSIPVLPALVAAHPTLAKTLGAIALLVLAAYIYLFPYREYTLSFRNLQGPPRTSLVWGNLGEIIKAPPCGKHDEWVAEYGHTIRYTMMFGENRIVTTDPVALGYILQHSYEFIKPPRTNEFLVRMLGNGVLTAEGDVHRRQRRVLNPAFGPAAIRDMSPVFYDKAYELQRKFNTFIEDEAAADADGARKIDIMRYLGQTTLDVIGVAGFNYDFKTLSERRNPLAEAFNEMFQSGTRITALGILQNFFPILDFIKTKQTRIVKASRDVTIRIGNEIVDEKKTAIKELGTVEKDSDLGKDLLGRLMKANMAPDLRVDQKLTDAEVLAQITTFMLAGNETTSTALTWCLYRLAQYQHYQDRLRDEIRAVGEEQPSEAVVNALPFLDKVVHESLRLDSPVPGTIRMANEDMVVPFGTPLQGRDGKMIDSVLVKKGVHIFLPILTTNHSADIWGADAAEFNPDRYSREGIPKEQIPGVTYGNLLTFIGGARNCIGYRFALAEMKVILYVLIRSFKFDLLNSNPEYEKKAQIVMRPRVVGEEDAGLQMPLLVSVAE
ncbi:hypothetical protein VHUM_04196 [Vanrija humicola]|uniref:Cytochrome P450 n=1 Tax=Vanrija humicola TaxID=5417 RepID=A0A7D8YZ93_VANHU|nr:hypothetical protein VHUM_04196 [Vanrija humicola]